LDPPFDVRTSIFLQLSQALIISTTKSNIGA
jgi:hypothetical protein